MIGMYAHHAGSGHLHRVHAIRKHLHTEAVIFSSAPGADIILPMDTSSDGVDPVEETAGGTLHWAPLGVPGLSERLAMIAHWINQHHPTAFYVDCSVEVALFVRLMGVPVITIAMPGMRNDVPHQLGYAQATAIIAAWPGWVPVPEHLYAHADRLHMVGGISRFSEGSTGDPTDAPTKHRDGVVILRGAGGDDFEQRPWPKATILGGETLVDDPMPYLRGASVVIAAAGQNSVADLALAGAPAIILPQPRPFGEQDATARVLEEAEIAVVLDTFPTEGEWDALFQLAHSRAVNWPRWQTEGSAARAATVIENVANQKGV